MATSHHKKRKSSQEKHEELESVKRKKKSSRDGSRGRYVCVGLNFLFRAHQQICPLTKSVRPSTNYRRAKSGSRSSRSKAPGKVHSISELVKLVMSGEIKVPKCLGHYVEDRAQLLDQVFTILPESDVKGMLPDILKVRRLVQASNLASIPGCQRKVIFLFFGG